MSISMRFASLFLLSILGLIVSASISVPMLPVPMTLQSFAVLLIAGLLGPRYGVLAILCYLLLAFIGWPVLAGGSSGLAGLTGKTAGYLLGFLLSAFVVGHALERGKLDRPLSSIAYMLIGHMIILALGFLWLATKIGTDTAFFKAIVPFIPGAIVKSVAAALIIVMIRKWASHVTQR